MSEPTPSSARTGSSILLIVSVCLNVALIAMIAAAIASSVFRHSHERWARGPLGINALVEAATPDERSRIEAIIKNHQSRLRELARDADSERAAAVRTFAQPTFDTAEYERTLDKIRLTNDLLQAEASRMMVEAASQLSPQERQELADRAARKSFWHPWRHRPFWW